MALQNHPTVRFRDLVAHPRIATLSLLQNCASILTYSGRGAIFRLLQAQPRTDRNRVLVPSFHCPTLVDPILEAGYSPVFYRINSDLSIDVENALNKLNDKTKAIIVVNYFGFSTDLSGLLSACEALAVPIIEDCAHSFLKVAPLRMAGERGDAAIFSFKKLCPTLVGGGTRLNSRKLARPNSLTAPPLRQTIVNWKQLFEQAVNNLPSDSRFRATLQRLEQARVARKRSRLELPERVPHQDNCRKFSYPFDVRIDGSRMPLYAKRILATANLSDIAANRRHAFNIVNELLRRQSTLTPIFSDLDDYTVPWAFPLTVANRSVIDIQLSRNGMPVFTFGETLHPLLFEAEKDDPEMVQVAKTLSDTLLAISIHQPMDDQRVTTYANALQRCVPGYRVSADEATTLARA